MLNKLDTAKGNLTMIISLILEQVETVAELSLNFFLEPCNQIFESQLVMHVDVHLKIQGASEVEQVGVRGV